MLTTLTRTGTGPTPLHLGILAALVALAMSAFTLHPDAAVAALTQTVALARTLVSLFLVSSGGTPGALAVLFCAFSEAAQVSPAVASIVWRLEEYATTETGLAFVLALAGAAALSSSTRHALGFVSALIVAQSATAAPLLVSRWLTSSLPAPPAVDGVDGVGGALPALGLLTTAVLLRR
ncbi:hypothetical protein EMVG_00078 [Emiliania huxleyi virus PS401]|nr:hypothetical protein EMVG_00078 [Emiliania huxleyi virus PS401]